MQNMKVHSRAISPPRAQPFRCLPVPVPVPVPVPCLALIALFALLAALRALSEGKHNRSGQSFTETAE